MRCSEEGKKMIKGFEGLRLSPYKCQAGKWTIGYGHLMDDDMEKLAITAKDADRLFNKDISRVEDGVTRLLHVDVSQGQFDVLCSFVFNLGLEAFKMSTILQLLNANRHEKVSNQLIKWVNVRNKAGNLVKSDGLLKRRQAEIQMWLSSSLPQKSEEQEKQ